MPELPEVETTRRGIAPHLTGRTIVEVLVRHPRLRWPVPRGLAARVKGQRIHRVERRAKYLLLRLDTGTLILHLGMSGSLRVLSADSPPGRHDHLDIVLDGGSCLRLTDPRRFGAVLWTTGDPMGHELIRHLGPEPLDDAFDGAYLDERARRRTVPVKQFIMDGEVVVGVGNIYANEALFMAGIHPRRPAGRIARKRYDCLAAAIKAVLNAAIDEGGTTLRDFVNEQGRPGYFSLKLKVYGRAGEPCTACGRPIRQIRQGQRSSFYCASCQH